MSRLTDLFTAVKEQNLTKYQLEDYYKELSELYGAMHLELGSIKKNKALFLLNSTEPSVAAKNLAWAGSQEGQREIELKSYIKATSTYLSSLKNRMFNTY